MIRIIEKEDIPSFVKNRGITFDGEAAAAVNKIIARVRRDGDKALAFYTKKFDKAIRKSIEVTREEIDEAVDSMDGYFLETLRVAKENITFFHKNQLTEGFRLEKEGGIVMGQKYTPVERAGIYVPGGTAAYPSTVLMNAVPAKIAGVERIIMVTPPGPDGKIKPEILAASRIAGVDRVFAVGGAQAVAALAYGTESIPKVDKIVGPGNIYVALAKRAVIGVAGIDMIAGPSEILIIADSKASPAHVAADLLSQAEHDRLASPVLVTDSRELALRVRSELETQLASLPRMATAREAVDCHGAIIIAENIDECVAISNEIAPEHLELCAEDYFGLLEKVRNAGSVFLGGFTPEPLGDYVAGPNHTLPTSGSARFSSPLSVDDFRKKTSYLLYTEGELNKIGGRVMNFAKREGLEAHARAIQMRMKGTPNEQVF